MGGLALLWATVAAAAPASITYDTRGNISQICTPTTCAAQGKNCGTIPDGCGRRTPSCGTCPAGQTCSASNVCVCQATTCAAQGKNCGTIPDGCGGTTQSCGTCAAGQTCSASNVCVCQPTTCGALGYSCGSVSDGCGGTLLLGRKRLGSVRLGASSRTVYLRRDRLGSVVATTLGGGQAGASCRYAAYGALEVASGDAGNAASEIGYAGALRLTGGLLLMGARVYHPGMKTFLQTDPLEPFLYRYTEGDPVNFADPSGMTEESDQQAPGGRTTTSQPSYQWATKGCNISTCSVMYVSSFFVDVNYTATSTQYGFDGQQTGSWSDAWTQTYGPFSAGASASDLPWGRGGGVQVAGREPRRTGPDSFALGLSYATWKRMAGFSAEMGSALTLRLTDWVLSLNGASSVVDASSTAYLGGQVAGYLVAASLALGTYEGLPIAGSAVRDGWFRWGIGAFKLAGEMVTLPHSHLGLGASTLMTHHLPWQAQSWAYHSSALFSRWVGR